MDSAASRRTRLARDLMAALEQEQFRVTYQPVVGLAERRILGLEALVRGTTRCSAPSRPTSSSPSRRTTG